MARRRTNPLVALAILVGLFAVGRALTSTDGERGAEVDCGVAVTDPTADAETNPTVDAACSGSADEAASSEDEPSEAAAQVAVETGGPLLRAAEACSNVGYLCAELARADRIRLQRWRDFRGPLVVHVPRPDFEDPAVALDLQRAASLGVRAWNGQPFEIVADLRGDRSPHFAIRWVRSLAATQLGVARTRWSSLGGLSVLSLELVTRSPFDPSRLLEPRQVQLTAAHEMGHALGLPHSDSSRDVMYPTNTATSLSAQDYRTMESLYALPDGAVIER